MSTAVVADPSQHRVDDALRRRRTLWTVLPFAPSIIAYYAHLWRLPHYQFFPFALLAAYDLARRAVRTSTSLGGGGSRLVGVGVLLAAYLVLAIGLLLGSPWLGTVAAVPAVAVEAWRRGGLRAWRALGPAALMLLVTLRPPLNADTHFIAALQRITTSLADRLLDALGVLHNVAGNVIEIPGRRLFVEEACSGVNSLFAALACTWAYLLYRPRRPFVWVVLTASVPAWVMFSNVLRVTTVAVLRSRWNLPVDESPWHDLLGYAVFLCTAGLLLATDQLLRFYAAVLPPSDFADRGVDALASSSASPSNVPSESPHVAAGRRSRLGPAVAIALLVVQIPVWRPAAENWAEAFRREPLAEFGVALLPADFDGWRCTDFHVTRRERDSTFGEHSQAWTLAGDGVRAVVSLDYPFSGWHELTECYAAHGWSITSRSVDAPTPSAGIRDVEHLPAVEVRMVHAQTARYGLLRFALVRADGRPLRPRAAGELDELRDRVSDRLRAWRADDGRAATTYQVQLFVESFLEPDAAAAARAARLFASHGRRLCAALARPEVAASADARGD